MNLVCGDKLIMKKFFKEFREFAVKGNVVDLAVAVIIGGAFGKIISSLVADIIMPLVGLIAGGLNFASWKWILRADVLDGSGAVLRPAVVMNIGVFVQNIFDFLIIALSIFLMIRIIIRLKSKLIKEEETAPEETLKLTKDQELLTEIRDALKNEKQQKDAEKS